MNRPKLLRFSLFLCTALAACLFTACDWYKDDDHDHNPPDGQGAIIVDNNTYNDVRVYFNGIRQDNTRDGKDKAYDLDPGVYRVVLDEKSGNRNFRGDVDVLENKSTVINIAPGGSSTRFDIAIFFD